MIASQKDLEAMYGPQLEELKERGLEYAAVARERFSEGSDAVKDYVTREPARALAVALGVGVLLGWLIKRR